MPVSVEGINAVVLRFHIDYIVDTLARNRNAPHVKRLSINLPIDRQREEFTELVYRHIGGGQEGFIGVLAGAGIVITLSVYPRQWTASITG